MRCYPIERLEGRLLLSAWYVSAAAGSDANPGTLSQPFKTIQQAANSAGPDDTVFIRGGTYHEAVVPPRSGTAGAPITFEPYGREIVTIDGADPVAGLVRQGPFRIAAAMPWDLGNGQNQVFLDGKMLTEARWPNSSSRMQDLFAPAFARAAAVSVQPMSGGMEMATISAPGLGGTPGEFVGATIHIAPGQEWVFQTGTVIASSADSLTYTFTQLTNPEFETPGTGNRFYLTGNMQFLDAPGEWYRDPATGTLEIIPNRAVNPRAQPVEAKRRLYAFDLSGRSFINIVGLHLHAATINTDASSADIVLNGLTAQYVSNDTINPDPWAAQFHPHTTGIILNGTNNVIENSTIQYSSGDGVFLGGSNNTVQNCVIADTDYAGGDEAAVSTLGAGEQVIGNTILRCGRSGVVIRYSPGSAIIHNRISQCGLLTTDLGGVYTLETDGMGTRIAYNLISDIHSGGFGGAGIYLDNDSANYIVDHNVVWNVDIALKMNPTSHSNQVYNNTLIGDSSSLDSQGGTSADMSGSVFSNNIFAAPAVIGSGASQSNNLFPGVNPMFVNPRRHNYQLRRKSPAIDAGRAIPSFTTGYSGAAPDIGAYEFGVRPFSAGATLRVTPALRQ